MALIPPERLRLVDPSAVSGEIPRILLVDDSAAGRRFHDQFEHEFQITAVRTPAEALAALAGEPFALLIIGVSFSSRDLSELLRRALTHYPSTVRVLLGASDQGALNEAFIQARTHYWLSPTWEPHLVRLQLLQAIDAYQMARENRRLARDVHLERQRHSTMARELFETHERLRRALHLAETDGLTGLNNFRHFNRILWQEFKRASRSGLPFSLVMIDVDKFKAYNDDFGHPAGDEALKTLAQILRSSVRAHDTVARYGGEEFVLLLPETAKLAAMRVTEKLRDRLKQTRPGSNWRRPITASFGLATFPDDSASEPQSLLEIADKALYLAKSRGRDRIEHYSQAAQNA